LSRQFWLEALRDESIARFSIPQQDANGYHLLTG
jgi:hypothetical protein